MTPIPSPPFDIFANISMMVEVDGPRTELEDRDDGSVDILIIYYLATGDFEIMFASQVSTKMIIFGLLQLFDAKMCI